MFVHVGTMHLLGNMFFLWIFGDNIEDALGHKRFLLAYLIFGIIAALSHALPNMGSRIPMVGASGAIAGVMGAYFILFPRANIMTMILGRVYDIPAYIYLGQWIALQIYFSMASLADPSGGGVAWLAHVGGFIAGAAGMALYRKRMG